LVAPILITGFGPFGKVRENGSERLVQSLVQSPPPGLPLVGGILPVEFGAVGPALERLLEGPGRGARAVGATGVHRGDGLRSEARARRDGGADSERTDNAGRRAADEPLDSRLPAELWSPLDLESLVAAVAEQAAAPGVGGWISREAGGYVCERACFHALRLGKARAIPALFVHVPSLESCPTPVLRRAFEALLRRI